MSSFEVFDASILQHLQIGTWFENGAFAELVSASTTTTSDGHLVLWDEPTGSALRRKLFHSIDAAFVAKGYGLNATFYLHVFYAETLWWGSHMRLERISYATEKLPEVFGNGEDQPRGYTILTIVSNKRTLDLLFDKWKSCLSRAGGAEKSAFYLAASGGAVQARFSCEEVRIEDVIDFYIAAALAIKEERKSRMILGLSYTKGVTSAEKKEPYTSNLMLPNYPSVTMIKVSVEEKYGPFARVSSGGA